MANFIHPLAISIYNERSNAEVKSMQSAMSYQTQGALEDKNYELYQFSHQSGLDQSIPRNKASSYGPHRMKSHANVGEKIVFSSNQLAALRYQIMAYKLLSKDTPIPFDLQQAVLAPLHTFESAFSPSTPTISKPYIQQQLPHYHEPNYKRNVHSSQTRHTYAPSLKSTTPIPASVKTIPSHTPAVYNSYVPPFDLLMKPIPSYAHASKHQRIILPSLSPVGIDPFHIISQREARILYQVQNNNNIKDAESIKQVIRSRASGLIHKQNKVRDEIVTGVSKSTVLASASNPKIFRMKKKPISREVHSLDAMEEAQRNERVQLLMAAKQSRLQTICEHGMKLVNGGKLNQGSLSKLGRAVIHYHQHIQKEMSRRTDRIAKESIRALRNSDEVAYMKLIHEVKDIRLAYLLKQARQFLESLSLSVIEQKNESSNPIVHDNTLPGSNYFQLTHSIRETVSQPNILVGGRLKDHQIEGLQWLVSMYNNRLNGILTDEIGLGKTIQIISLVTYLIEKKHQTRPFLIVAPLSTISNWIMEFDKWAPSVTKIVYTGSPQTRRDLSNTMRNTSFQVLLTTFEYIIRDRTSLCHIKWLYVILDEEHHTKNNSSKLITTLRQSYHSQFRLVLTSTPLQNNLPELWSLVNFILPRIFKSVQTFEEWFNAPFSNQGVQDKVGLNEEEQLLIIEHLHKMLRPSLLRRRLKSNVESKVPDRVERILKCKLSALQNQLYLQIKKHKAVTFRQEKSAILSQKGLQNAVTQLCKVCNHPFVFEGVEPIINPGGKSNELLYRCCSKLELLDRMLPKLKATGHRVLIFFEMASVMTILEDYLIWRKYRYLRLDGSTRPDDCSSLLNQFNQPNSPYFILLLSIETSGLELNLRSADTVILFDSVLNPHQDFQVQDREHRIGQTREVRVFKLITSNTVEEVILSRAQSKLDTEGKVIQVGKFDHRNTEKDREDFLRSLLDDKFSESDNGADEYMNDEKLNEILKRSDEELYVFERIDKEREREETEMYKRRGYRKRLDRLIQEDELPDIFTENEVLDIEKSPFADFGRGRRTRGNVRYNESTTEDEWSQALENDKSSNLTNRSKRRRQLVDDDEYEEGGELQKKKQAGNQKDPVAPHIRQQLTEIFKACYEAVKNSMEEDKEDGTYRSRCELFMDLVDKKEYPMYYTIIKNPMSINIIKRRIQTNYYSSIVEFKNDFHLIFDNARLFNEDESMVYEDANILQEIFDVELEKHCPNGTLPVKAIKHEGKRSSSRQRPSRRR